MSVNGSKLASELEANKVTTYLECVRQLYYFNDNGIEDVLNVLDIDKIFKHYGVRSYQINVHLHKSFSLEHVTRIIKQYQALTSATGGLDAHYCNKLSEYIRYTLSKCAIITSDYLKENPDYISLFCPVSLLIKSKDMPAEFVFEKYVLGCTLYKTELIEHLSSHAPFKLIRNNPEIDWKWRRVSENNSIVLEDVINNPSLPWSIHLFRNQLFAELLERVDCRELLEKYCGGNIIYLTAYVPLQYIVSNYNKLPWSVPEIKHKLQMKKNGHHQTIWDYLPLFEIYPELLSAFPDKESQNPPMSFVRKTLRYWSMDLLSRYVQPTDFLENRDLSWNYEVLLYNKNMPANIMISHIAEHVPWNSYVWYNITKDIDIDYIVSHPKNTWHWSICLDRLTHDQIWGLINYMQNEPGIYKKLSIYYPPQHILVNNITKDWDWAYILAKMDIPDILLQILIVNGSIKTSNKLLEISKYRIKSMYIVSKIQDKLESSSSQDNNLAPELIDMVIGYAVYL